MRWREGALRKRRSCVVESGSCKKLRLQPLLQERKRLQTWKLKGALSTLAPWLEIKTRGRGKGNKLKILNIARYLDCYTLSQGNPFLLFPSGSGDDKRQQVAELRRCIDWLEEERSVESNKHQDGKTERDACSCLSKKILMGWKSTCCRKRRNCRLSETWFSVVTPPFTRTCWGAPAQRYQSWRSWWQRMHAPQLLRNCNIWSQLLHWSSSGKWKVAARLYKLISVPLPGNYGQGWSPQKRVNRNECDQRQKCVNHVKFTSFIYK